MQNNSFSVAMMNPAIAGALSAANYDEDPSCAEAGHVELDLVLNIKNTGDTNLDQLSVGLDLTNQLGAAFIKITEPPVVQQANFTDLPDLNPNFAGTAVDSNLFIVSDSIIGVGDSLSVVLRVMLDPNAGGAINPMQLQFLVSGRALDINEDPLPDPILVGADWIVLDRSDAGIDTDNSNLNYIGDTGGTDDALPLNLPNIGLSKSIVAFAPAASNVAGNVDVTFRLALENIGNTPLSNISINDDFALLGSSFVTTSQQPTIISSNAASNPFTGAFPTIFNGMGGSLLPAEGITVDFKIEINPDENLLDLEIKNAAVASAIGKGLDGNSIPISDKSDAGFGPENINDNYPGDTGCENDTLDINLPVIRAAQHVVGIADATSHAIGHFDVIFQVLLQNVGNVEVTDLEILENLKMSAQLGNALVDVTGLPQIISTGINGTPNTASANPNPNNGYDGSNDLLDGGGQLLPGEITILQYQVEVNPDALGAPSVLRAQATARANGIGIDGNLDFVSDLSDSGFIPQSNNPNRPGDTGKSNDPTLLTNCFDQVSGGIACNDNVQVSLNGDCMVLLTPSMVLEGEFEQCDSDSLLPLSALIMKY